MNVAQAMSRIDELEAELMEARDPRLWSVDQILEHLDVLAKRCVDEDWCSMAPTELSYCATERAVAALRRAMRPLEEREGPHCPTCDCGPKL